MTERRRSPRAQGSSIKEIREKFFRCNRRELMVAAFVWFYDEPPTAADVNELIDEVDKGNIPLEYQQFIYQTVRPAVLAIDNKSSLPVRAREVIKQTEIAIKQFRMRVS